MTEPRVTVPEAASIAVVVLVLAAAASNLWPPEAPYVTVKGTTVHETIWVWRAPAYLLHPAWRVRWEPADGLHARAYCYDPEASAAWRAEHPR